MSQINFECLFFDDTDDETEVNSLLSGFLIDVTLVIQASTPTIQKYQRSYMPRDRYGAHDRLFQEGCDVVRKADISALVKCTSAIRQLAYAVVPDSLDEYLQIGEKTSRDCLMHFCNGVIELYDEEYLRRPTQTDVEKLYAFHENKHGFPGSNDVKRIRYKQAHEAARKDVERAFGVLKKKWAIVRTPARSRSLKRITHLMYHMQSYDIYGFEEKERQSLRFYPEEQHHEMIP
ncbi:reverse transcriptase domain-containing protein [Tanacetum coccineum]